MNYKENCLAALKTFIEESSNENKLELYMAYEEIEDEIQRQTELDENLNTAFCTILYQNQHDDAFLAKLKSTYF